MCVDCVLASSRIGQFDPGDEPLFEVVLSQSYKAKLERLCSARLARHDQMVKLLNMQRL
jgi:hypothetical protein